MKKILLFTIGILLVCYLPAQQDNSLHRVEKNGKWGYVDDKGNEVIRCQYDHAYPFYDSDLALVESGGLFGYIDKQGQVKIPLQYQKAYPFSDGRAAVKMNGKYGFINQKGQTELKFEYDDVKWGVVEGYAWVNKGKKGKKTGKWGLIEKDSGVTFVRFDYINLIYFDPNTGAADAVTKDGVIHYYLKGKKYPSKKERDEAVNPTPPPIKKNAPTIEWPTIPSQTEKQFFAFKAQIKSDSKIEYCKLYLNGEEVPLSHAPSGSFVVREEVEHNLTINETLSLAEGSNTIKIKVANQGGVIEEQRNINYIKPVVVEKAIIVWNDIPATTMSPDFTVKAEIKSTNKSISYQVFLNGTEQLYNTKGSYVVPDEKKDGEYSYSMLVNKALVLSEGNNNIQIIVKDSKGETLASKQQSITYIKPEPPVIVWEGTYPEKTTKEQLLAKATISSKSEITDWEISLSSSGNTKGSYVVKEVVENGKSKSVSKTVTLKPGYNTIEVEATNADGMKATKQLEIWYSPCEKRLALVIGNQNYSHFDRLKKCRNDADTIANLLEKECSFDIIIVKDANYITMNNKINEFIDRVKIDNYSTAIIYYSGHGLSFSSEKGDNYLIPIDCNNCKEDVERYGFDVKTKLLDRLDKEAKGSCNVKIAMLDCCRQSELNLCNTPPSSTFKGTVSSKGLSKMDIPYGIAVFYGAEFGHVSYDGDSYNSPYVQCFVEYFRSHPKANWRDLGFDVSEMVKDATKDYKDNNGNKAPQIPQHEINKFHGAKDFYLNPYHDKP